MAAGVGKTFSMLKEGRQKQEEGVDVVIGYLESHQRKETDELAAGNRARAPDDAWNTAGRRLQEMDLDAVLAPQAQPGAGGRAGPHERARARATGSGTRTSWSCIEHGIDVFTTVNVQHLEGFADTVEEITGITIAERIPDSVFDVADQVVLIDLSPEELLKRLAEGKVYLGDRAQAAAENFFKKSTLTALREMALRHTALLVTHQLADYAQEHEPAGRRRSRASASWWPSARARTPRTSSAGPGRGPSTSRRSGRPSTWRPARPWATRRRNPCGRT